MSKLSPAAQAVSYVYDNAPEKETGNHRYYWLAAALREAADQASAPDHHEEDAFHAGFWAAIEYVQSIAEELEAL